MTIKERVAFLQGEIAIHNIAYYDNDDPIIADYAYDELVQELHKLETENPELLTADSPTQIVGGTPDKSMRQVKHTVPMLSLSNIFNPTELQEFCTKVGSDIVAEYKIDGLSCSLVYSREVSYSDNLERAFTLKRAVTRGDGTTGELISESVRDIIGIPKRIFLPKEVYPSLSRGFEVRGELYMPHSAFEALNKTKDDSEKFANPRNATAGIVRRKTKKDNDLESVRFMAYFLMDNSGNRLMPHIGSQRVALSILNQLGFTCCTYNSYEDVQEIKDFITEMETKRSTLDIPTDGIVLKVNDIAKCIELGAISKSPKWATAYKFPPEEAVSVIEDVIWQVGRSGKNNLK